MGKKHPLDVFRTSATGFDTASRERRTLLGRVVASAPRGTAAVAAPASAAAPAALPRAASSAPVGTLPPAVAATRERMLAALAAVNAPVVASVTRERVAAPTSPRPLQPPVVPMAPERRAAEPPRPRSPAAEAKPKPKPQPKAEPAESRPLASRINRALLVSACTLVVSLALWTVVNSFGGPALKSVAPVAPATPAAAFHVLATSYPGTPAGMASAFSARDLLRQQGFADTDVLAWPGSTPDSYSRFDLVVGKAGSEAALADVAKKLRGLKNWPGTVKQPFKDAKVLAIAP